MKTLNDLTPEIRNKFSIYKEKCIKDLYSGNEYNSFNRKTSVNYIEKIYEICKFKKPVIIFAEDPIDYIKKLNELNEPKTLDNIYKIYLRKNKLTANNKEKFSKINIVNKSHYLFLCSAYHRVYLMWYKFIQDEFQIEHKNKEILNWLYENANNNITRCYFTKLFVLVLKMPKYINRNNIGFHNINGGAIEWENYKMYYVNGRKLSEELYNKTINKTLTFNEYIKIIDENIKGSILSLMKEKFGNDYIMSFLNAKIVNEETINHSSGYSETIKLWKTNEKYSFLSDINGNMNQPYAWVELTCPSTNSIFFIETSAHFTTAIEASKFHRPKQIPMELKYNFNSFNN